MAKSLTTSGHPALPLVPNDRNTEVSLASRLQAETPIRRLTFAEWRIALTPTDRAALEEAGKNPAWSNAAIARIVKAEGGPANKDTIAKWRAEL